jgi:dipeptidyl aminopeptidase/acylaminoacyl peptidase
VLAAILCGILAIVLIAERAVRMTNRGLPPESAAADLLNVTHARLDPVEVRAADAIALRGWLFTPRTANGGAVIVLHGVGETRIQILDRARFLLDAGYVVLTPDSRGHGDSGGATVTYGVREAADVSRWVDLLLSRPGVSRVYGLGLSLGGAILIEALPTAPRLRAVVADCPFATFEEAAYNRLDRRLYLPRLLAWPVVRGGLLYVRAVYATDLRAASPEDAIRRTKTPVLLIHGVADGRTPIAHSRRLHAINPAATTLWEVAGADHGGAITTAPDLYRQRVIEWFGTH